MPGVEGQAMSLPGEHGNIVDMPTNLKGFHGIDYLAGDVNDTGHSTVGYPNRSFYDSQWNGTLQEQDAASRQKRLSTSRRFCHIDNYNRPHWPQSRHSDTRTHPKTDRVENLTPSSVLEYHRLMSLSPPVVIVGQQQVI